jgi:hypothetical protein
MLQDSDGNGQCGAWADLFCDALVANGISSQEYEVTPKSSDLQYFLIKDWLFGFPFFGGVFPYRLRFATNVVDMVPVPPGSVYGDLTSLSTLFGQNTSPPAEKVFNKHWIVKYGSTYYDPSYGITHTGEDDFETNAVEGYARKFPGDNGSGFTNFVLREKVAAGLHKIKFTPTPR